MPVPLDELLAAVLRGDSLDVRAIVAHGADAIDARATDHDVLPLVANRLLSAAALPVELRARFETEAHEAVVLDLAVEVELRRLLKAFAASGVEMLLIKGGHLAYGHYARPDLRARIDSDVLIARAQREIADEILTRQLGYVVDAKVSGDLTATQKLYVLTRNDAVVHLVDLHWRLASPQVFAHVLSFEELLASSVPLHALGPTARGPSDVHALLIACMHRVAHHHDEADQFKWLYDVHLIASRFDEAAWTAIAALAAERAVAAVCLDSLERSARWFHTAIPSQLRTDARFVGAERREQTAAYLQLRPQGRRVLDDLRALPSWGDRLHLAREHLFPGPAYMRQVYAPSSRLPLPVLYARRIVRGMWGWFRPPT